MVVSKACDYALRATLYMALQPHRMFIPIREIAEKLHISFHFLTKILQILTQQQLVQSFKGPNGGVALDKPAAEIPVMAIVTAIDGSKMFQNCLLGLVQCDDDHPCPLHNQWSGIRSQIQRLFENTHLQQLADKVRQEGYHLVDLHLQSE